MSWNVKDDGESFEKAPEGLTRATCIKLIDLGTHFNEKFQKDRHQIMLGFELPDELMTTGEFIGKPFVVTAWYTLSLAEKANLRKDIESWFGKKMDKEKLKKDGFDITALLGRSCMLNITHEEKNGNTRAVISAITPLVKNMPKPERINDIVLFSLDNFDADIFDSLSDKMKNFISSSKEYQGLFGNRGQRQETENPAPSGSVDDFDDDIPF